MITVTINRKTGERTVTNCYSDPSDEPIEATGHILAKMMIEYGMLDKFKPSVKLNNAS